MSIQSLKLKTATIMKQRSTLSSNKVNYDHHHLLVKQLKAQKLKYKIDVRSVLMDMNLNYYFLNKEKKKQLYHQIMNIIHKTQEGQQYFQYVKKTIKERVDDLYSSQTRKTTYYIDCLRQAASFPFVKDRQDNIYNFLVFHKKCMSRELRRLMWSKQFINDFNKMNFQKYDRQVMPYNVSEQLKMTLEKIGMKQKFSLKQNQKDIALRIMEYFVKYQKKIPHRHCNYLALLAVDLFSFFTISKVHEVGAVCLGLVNLVQYYHQSNNQTRFNEIMKAIELVDIQNYQLITSHYLQEANAHQSKKELNQAYQLCRLTFGACFLPYEASQFFVDQLLIRKKCRFDMYVLFAIMLMIISDQFSEKNIEHKSLKQVIERSKQIIKKQDIIDSYSVIYGEVPPFFTIDDLSNHNNRLLQYMISYNSRPQSEQNNPLSYDAEDNDQSNDGFVVDIKNKARIGKHM